jgi:hypothetical protein
MRACTVWLLVVLALPLLSAVELEARFDGPQAADALLEWELRDAPQEWLVLDTEHTPRLVITDPSGQQWTRSAFVYQDGLRNPLSDGAEYIPASERHLRIRHTARVIGEHRWALQAPDGSEVASGSFTATAALGHPGPLRVSSANPRLLAYADDTPFIPIGPNIAWALGPDRQANLDRYFTRLAEQGGTHARVWLASWCGQFEGEVADAYDLPQAWLADRIFASARAHGIRLTVVIDNHHDLVYGKRFPYGGDYVSRAKNFLAAEPGEQYLRKLRYLLARWGADDTIAVWELFNEVDMACLVREISIPWIVGASNAFRVVDQDRRLLTVSWAGNDWDVVFDRAQLDMVQLRGYVHEWLGVTEEQRQFDRDGVGLMVASAARANRRDRPFWYGEVGYQGRERENPGNDLDTNGLLMRQQAWAGFLLGGCGSAMNWWWDVYIDESGLWGIYGGLAKAVAAIDWRDPELVPVTPNAEGVLRVIGWRSPSQAMLWPQLRADTWYHHLVEEVPRPTLERPFGMQVPGFHVGQTYTVRWQHQVSGAVVLETTGQADAAGRLSLRMPAGNNDLVVLVVPAAPAQTGSPKQGASP